MFEPRLILGCQLFCQMPATHLSWQQGVLVHLLEACQQLVLGCDQVLCKLAIDGDPVGPAIQRDAGRQLAIAQPPHVGVALVKHLVQALLLDKSGT